MDIYHKICTKCKLVKPLSEFHKHKASKDGHRCHCKDCRRQSNIDNLEYIKDYRKKNSEKIKNNKKEYRKNNKEKISLAAKDYYIRTVDDRKKYSKSYRLKNIDKIKEREKNKRSMYKDELNRIQRERRNSNKEHTNAQAREYQKKRRQSPVIRLGMNISRSLRRALTHNGLIKKSSITDIIGCSMEAFKLHIEQHFDLGMSFDNYGEWHLDHIIPISFGKNYEEIILLNHYTNFRPLWKAENISKGNILTNESINHPLYLQIIEQRNKPK